MTAPIIFQQPGWGEAVAKGLAPLLQALQQTQERKLREQQLATQQMVAQANIQDSAARLELSKAEAERRARLDEADAKASKAIESMMTASEGEVTRAGVIEALGGLKADAISAFLTKLPSAVEALTAPEKVKTAELGVQQGEQNLERGGVALDTAQLQLHYIQLEAPIREAGNREAKKLLRNPNAPFPTDPTLGEATALGALGLLSMAQQHLQEQLTQGAGGAIIFARQLAVGASESAYREYLEEINLGIPLDSLAAPNDRKRVAKFLPPGMEYAQYTKLTKSATDAAIAALGGLAGGPQDIVDPLNKVKMSPAFTRLDEQAQADILATIETALQYDSIEELRAALQTAGVAPSKRALILAGYKARKGQ